MIRRAVLYTYQFGMAMAVLIVAGFMEPLYFPVVRDWTVTKIERVGDAVILSGYMKKVRNCEFVGVVAQDDAHRRLPLKYLDNPIDDTATRPVGAQNWGPWQVVIQDVSGVAKISMSATHSCHVGWHTVTQLGEVKLYPGVQQ